MKSKSILTVACVATMMFASCSNDDHSNEFIKGDKEAQLNIAIAFPQTDTRAVSDANASTNELKVTDVTVFIFENGTAATGNGTTLSKDKFDETSNNVFTLKDDEKIKTTNGTKNIYVGVNLPASMKGFTAENDLIKAVAVTPADLQSANGSAMFSVSAVSKYLEPSEDTEPVPTTNLAEVEVERLVAKVAVTHGTSTQFTTEGVKYTVDKFAVGQFGTSMFPNKRIEGGKLVTPYARNGAPTTLLNVNANNVASDALVADYVVENATKNLLGGEATYAVIRTSFVPEKLSKVENDAVVQETNGLAAGVDIWVVRHDGKVYYAATETIADEVAQKLMEPNSALQATKQEYKSSYCYYYVYLNDDNDAKKLEVHRNDFIHITVNGVKGLGASGDVNTNGETPVSPKDPDEPVVKSDTYLLVKIDVKAWNYTQKGVELQ